MLNWLKEVFKDKNIRNEFQEITKKSLDDINIVYSKEVQKDFNEEYQKIIIEVGSVDIFKKRIQELIIKNIRKTEYKNESVFINEIGVFIYYLFLIIEDNYKYGHNTLKENFTNFDDYIFGAAKLEKDLKLNIEKMLFFLKNKRFSDNDNDNIISYFVFLEENGVSISRIVRDFFALIEGKKIQN